MATLMEARTRESLERAVARGIAQGIAQGRAEGERMLLRRQAERRFGAETAAQLSDLLADVEEPEDLIEAGEWIVDCRTGDERLSGAVACARRDAPRMTAPGRSTAIPLPDAEASTS